MDDDIVELLRLSEKQRKERELAFHKIKGMLEVIRSGKMSEIESAIFSILDMVVNGFYKWGDDVLILNKYLLVSFERLDKLEKSVDELQKTVFDLVTKKKGK
jgi:hypothetical protein